MTKFLSLIDSGSFFIHPMRWLYVVFACLSFVPALVILYFMYEEGVDGVLGYTKGWIKFSGYLFCFIFAIFVIVSALLMFYYWMNRSHKVAHIINEGDQIVAMPVWAHMIQSSIESFGVYIAMIPSIGATLFYLWCVITGFKYVEPNASIGDIFILLLIGLLGLAFFIFICLLLSYIIILVAHYVGESIRVRAQIANDVRDLGDIHRAATLLREADAAAVETEA
jgi:hypothetical protein